MCATTNHSFAQLHSSKYMSIAFFSRFRAFTLLGGLRDGLRGFAARLWLCGVAWLGFADDDACALMWLKQVESMRKGAMKGGFRTRGHGWASKASRRLCGGFAPSFPEKSIIFRQSDCNLPVVLSSESDSKHPPLACYSHASQSGFACVNVTGLREMASRDRKP